MLDDITLYDPFQLSTPCWLSKNSVFWNLQGIPPIKGATPMGVKVINEVEAKKPRRADSSKVAKLSEYMEGWANLKNLLQGKAMEITLEDSSVSYIRANSKNGDKVNPAKVMAMLFQRRFTKEALPFSAYATDQRTIYIKRDTDKKQPVNTGKKK